MLRLLVVEDTPALRTRAARYFTETLSGYEVLAVASRDEAISIIASSPPDLVLLDLVIPGSPADGKLDWSHGGEVLEFARQTRPHVPVIILSSRRELTRDFLKERGATDFFTKDDPEAWHKEKLPQQVDRLIGHLACCSAPMQRLRTKLGALDGAGGVLLLGGPPGSGRRHLASVVHRCSPARDRPLQRALLPGMGPDELRALLADARWGALLLEGLDRVPLVEPVTQVALARAVSKPPQDRWLGLVVERSSGELLADADLLPELARELRAVQEFRMPGLCERKADIPELAECFRRQAALDQNRPVRRLSDAAHAALMEGLEAGQLEGEVAGLRALVEAAVGRAASEAIEPGGLGMELPAAYAVLRSQDGVVEELRLSVSELEMLEADPALELLLHADQVDGSWCVTRARQGEHDCALDDRRLGRLLFLIAVQPGEKVEFRQRKRDLGLLEHEQVRRYVFLLRQALHDDEVRGRESRFIASHYGEAFSLKPSVSFALVRPLSGVLQAPDPDPP